MSRLDKKEYTDWKGFGERIKNSRESLGLTREKFSEMIDRTENYELSLEKGDKSCSIHTLHQICSSLKEPADYILYGDAMRKNIKNNGTNKEVLIEIINRCNDEELEVIKDLIVATYPNLKKIINKRKVDKN